MSSTSTPTILFNKDRDIPQACFQQRFFMRGADPLKIVLWYWGRRGGGAQFTLGLARALAARRDVALTLYLSDRNELLEESRAVGCPLVLANTYHSRATFLSALPRLPALTGSLARIARASDVVISTMTHLFTPLVARYLSAPFVPVVHDAVPHPGDPGLFWNWRLGSELRAARAAVVLSNHVATALQDRAPDLPILRMHLPALYAGMYPAPDNPPYFLMFGRLRRYKGLCLLRDAFALLRQSYPGVRLRIVGEGDAEACAPGISRMPGVTVEERWVPEAEIPILLGAATAVVLPYTEASQSGVVPQALALGVPVVATAVGGLREQVREGAGGLLAEATTPAALAHAMSRVLDPGTLAALRTEARLAGEKCLDWDGEAAALVWFLRHVLRPVQPDHSQPKQTLERTINNERCA